MIWFYSGTPGSGKSLHVARDIYHKLNRNSCVICNFGINMDMYKYELVEKEYTVPADDGVKTIKKKMRIYKDIKGTCMQLENYQITPEFLINYAKAFFPRDKHLRIKEASCLLVIDECQLIFNAREWNARGRDKWISFFTQHRKFGYNIILISQFDRLVDRQIRSLIEYEVKHRKLNNYNFFGKFIGLLFGGSAFVAIEYWYGAREKIGVEYFGARKRYCEFYDSYKIFSA